MITHLLVRLSLSNFWQQNYDGNILKNYIFCVLLTYISLSRFFRKRIFNKIQHFVHFNLSLSLLMGLIVFVAGIEAANDNEVSSMMHTTTRLHNYVTHYIANYVSCYLNLCTGSLQVCSLFTSLYILVCLLLDVV